MTINESKNPQSRQYNQQKSQIKGFAPDAVGSNVVAGENITGNSISIINYYYRDEIKLTPIQSEGISENIVCPYRGLFHFGPNDAEFFYGREIFVEQLVRAIHERNFLAVIGGSGSGKSSVVMAGLVPKLQQQSHWLFTHFRPGSDPFHALALALVPLYRNELDATDKIIQARKLAEAISQKLIPLADVFIQIQQKLPQQRILVIIDQFEELFTLCPNEEIRRQFLNTLLLSFQTSNEKKLSSIILAITLRADFLSEALSYRILADILQNKDIKLGAMSESELLQVIKKPAESLGVSFESGLIERILEDVKNQPGNLPLLEFGLTLLWDKREKNLLTHGVYESIGRVKGALADYADVEYNRLNLVQKNQLKQIFVQLVCPGQGTEDTKRIATKKELGESNWALVQHLADLRLVITGRSPVGLETVELVHEALIQEWMCLRQWIEADRDFRAWQERLRVAIQQWNATGRDEAALLRGKPLADAQEWLHKRPQELVAEEEYIQDSLKLQEKERQKLFRQRKRTLIGLVSGLVGALGLAAIAGIGWWQATSAATNERIKALVSESQSLFVLSEVDESSRYNNSTSSNDFPLTKQQQVLEEENGKRKEILFLEASLKAIKAGREMQQAIGVETETRFQVLETLRRIVATKEEPTAFTLSECEPRKRGLISLTWTSDRQTIACVNYDGTVRLWDSTTGQKIKMFQGETEWVDDVVFSPDGKMIASGTADGTVNLWNPVTGTKIRELKGHLSQVQAIRFSPDSQILAAANYDGTIIFWEVETGRELKKLLGHSDEKEPVVDLMLFSPNGQFFGSRNREIDGTLRIWEVATGKEIKTLRPQDLSSSNPSFIFTPDSQTLIYFEDEYNNKRIRFWNILNKKEIKNISVLGGAYFSSNGEVIAVIDQNEDKKDISKLLTTNFAKGSVSLWNTATGKKVKTLNISPNVVPSKINFSPDGSFIAIYSYDYDYSRLGSDHKQNAKISLWDQTGKKIQTVEQLGEIFQMNYSPDNKKIAISSFGSLEDGYHVILNLWDVATGKKLKTLIDEPIKFSPEGLSVGLGTQFSPDGKIIVAVHSSGIAQFFDTSTGTELNLAKISPSHVISQRTSADEKVVLTLTTDGSIVFRERATGKEFKMNRYDSMMVSAVHITEDKTITTVNWSGKLQQRELTTGRILRSINLPFDKSASSLKFSLDGRKIAAARSNYTVKIWDATTGKETLTLKEYAAIVDEANDWRRSKVHFSPDGKIVAVVRTEDDQKNSSLELWNVSTGKAIEFSLKISGIKSISFSPNSDELAILKTNDTIQLWKLSTRQLLKTITPSLDGIWGIQFAPENELLFAFNSKELKLLNISTEREIASFKLPHSAPLNPSIDFSPDGKTLILQSDNKYSFLNFDLENLLKRSCDITSDYLKKNPSVSEKDKHICH